MEQIAEKWKGMFTKNKLCFRSRVWVNSLVLVLPLSEVNEWETNGYTLQRQNKEISKQIFPEKEYRGLSSNFNLHASVSDLYIPTRGLPILLKEICRPILGLYINRSQTQECWNWGWGRTIPRKGIHKWDFRCSVRTNVDFFSPHSQLLHSSLLPIIVFQSST